jgi:hypothetical protein
VTQERLEELIEEGLPRPITSAIVQEWIALEEGVDMLNPLMGYVLSFVAFHERGLGILGSRFLQGSPSGLRWSFITSTPTPLRRQPSLSPCARGT